MRRSTFVLLVVVAVALAAILLWERKRPGTDASKAEEGKIFPGLPEAKEFSRLARTGEAPLILDRSGEAWALKSPMADAADGYAVEGFLDRLRQAKAVRFLEGKVPPKGLGLEAPKATWTLTARGKTYTLALGEKADLGEGVYLKVGDRVALAPPDLQGLLLKKVEEFRGRDLMPPSSGRVVSFRVVRPGAPALAGSRSGEDWTLREPFADDADGTRVEQVLDAVTFGQASTFQEPGGATDFGMKQPRAEVTLTTDKGKVFSMKFGGVAPPGEGLENAGTAEERVYASVSGRPSLMVVPARILKELEVSPDTLRSLELFRHAAFDAEEFQVGGAYSLVMKRDAKGGWTFGAGAQAGKDATAAAEGLLDLRGVSATGPEAGARAPEPFVTLTLRGKGFEETVVVGPEVDGKRSAYPRARAAALLVDGEAWRRAEASLKAVSLAPAKK